MPQTVPDIDDLPQNIGGPSHLPLAATTAAVTLTWYALPDLVRSRPVRIALKTALLGAMAAPHIPEIRRVGEGVSAVLADADTLSGKPCTVATAQTCTSDTSGDAAPTGASTRTAAPSDPRADPLADARSDARSGIPPTHSPVPGGAPTPGHIPASGGTPPQPAANPIPFNTASTADALSLLPSNHWPAGKDTDQRSVDDAFPPPPYPVGAVAAWIVPAAVLGLGLWAGTRGETWLFRRGERRRNEGHCLPHLRQAIPLAALAVLIELISDPSPVSGAPAQVPSGFTDGHVPRGNSR